MAIARVALPVAASHLFDYWIPDGLSVAPRRCRSRSTRRSQACRRRRRDRCVDRVRGARAADRRGRRRAAPSRRNHGARGVRRQLLPGGPGTRVCARDPAADCACVTQDRPASTRIRRCSRHDPASAECSAGAHRRFARRRRRHVLADDAARDHRQRQDRGLSRRRRARRRTRRPGADPRARDQPDPAIRASGARRAARSASGHAAQPSCRRRAARELGCRGERRCAGHPRDASWRVRAAAESRADRRRRRARRLVQAAGRRALSRARSRRMAGAATRRSDRAWKRDAIAGNLGACAGRPIPGNDASRARGRPGASSVGAPRARCAGPARGTALRRRSGMRWRCALRDASSRCSSSIGAGTRLRSSARRATGNRSVRDAPPGSSCIASPTGCAAITADTRSIFRARALCAAMSTWCRWGSARSVSSRRFEPRSPMRVSRASTATRRATRARSPPSANRSRTTKSTS